MSLAIIARQRKQQRGMVIVRDPVGSHVHVAYVKTNSALLITAIGNILLQERGCPNEHTLRREPMPPWSPISRTCQRILRSREHVFHPLHNVTLCSLTARALELHCLCEIGVPHQIVLSTSIHLLVLPRDILQYNLCLHGRPSPILPRAELKCCSSHWLDDNF